MGCSFEGLPAPGKMMLLIELARELVDRACADPFELVPVYLSLSAWRSEHRDLGDWVTEQLDALYQVPRALVSGWLSPDAAQLLLLLDGLDEIADRRERQRCAHAIERFRETYPVPVVVCSREAEYDALSFRMPLQTAVMLLPLDPKTVLGYFRRAGDSMRDTVQTLERHPELLPLLVTPLLVSIVTLAYAGNRTGLPKEGSDDDFVRRLIADYIERRFELDAMARRSAHQHGYSVERTRRWLSFLAARLTAHGQRLLVVDGMEPDWLSSRRAQHMAMASPKIIFGVTVGLLHLLLVGKLASQMNIHTRPLFHCGAWIGFGILVALAERARMAARLAMWMAFGVTTGLLFLVLVRYETALDVLVQPLYFAVLFGAVGELLLRQACGWQRPAERWSWSWHRARPFVARGLLIGLLGPPFGFLYALGTRAPGAADTINAPVFWGAVFGPLLGLVFGLSRGLGGLATTPVPTRTTPNEGIRRSARNGVAVGATITLVSLVAFSTLGMFAAPDYGSMTGVLMGVMFGTVAGLLWAMGSGLGAVIQHVTLRLLLWRYGKCPLLYVRWLNDMVRMRLLYWGAEGGYTFIHGIVQQYFANPTSEPERANGHHELSAVLDASRA